MMAAMEEKKTTTVTPMFRPSAVFESRSSARAAAIAPANVSGERFAIVERNVLYARTLVESV